MTFLTQVALAADSVFISRTAQAAVAAINVMAESFATVGHVKRTAMAVQVLQSPSSWGGIFAIGVANNPAISAGSLDSDIQFTVNSLWDAYSGVIL
jgi:hypothetical protein